MTKTLQGIRKPLALITLMALALQLLSGMLSAHYVSAADAVTPDTFVDQPGAKHQWVVAGSFTEWNPSAASGKMKHFVGGYYAYSVVLNAGTHEFKLTKDGEWDTGFSNNGNNFSITLTGETKVDIFLNEDTKQARISVPGVAGLAQYVPSQAADKWPRLVGTVQPALGESAEWSPSTSQLRFVDYNFDGSVYKYQASLPVGNYEAKVIFGTDWEKDENYGAESGNLKINVEDDAYTIFSIDHKGDKVLSAQTVLIGGGFDGQINKKAIAFDSRSLMYKKPFGAIKQGLEDVTLRVAAAKDDVQLARVELTTGEGLATTYDMRKATTVGEQDFFEVTIPKIAFSSIGIWGFKFILIDGSTKVELGDDKNGNIGRGGTGVVVDEGAVPFDLTVYQADYHTPDWMKNAVVYQIFPDRFFDGDKSNNRAKLVDGYRGNRSESDDTSDITANKLQYFDGGVPNDPAPDQVAGKWSDVPENPDRIKTENKPYYPDAKSDGVWTNEFYGGDLQGVQQKLGYLKAIGINTIYFNPIAWAASNHKYDATDYQHLDPMFGEPVYNTPGDPKSGLNYEATRVSSDKIFIDFAKAAKAAGIHIIADGVFNHVGDDSIYFDRYEKYPEIGAYEYWAKVYDILNATAGKSLADAEKEAQAYYTAKINPKTGKNYKYPEDFGYTTWFTIENVKVPNRDDSNTHYKYDAWWGYDSLPAMDAKTAQPGDTEAIGGGTEMHEWNNIGYRDEVIGHDLTGKSEADAAAAMKSTVSQRWEWMGTSGWRLDVAPDVSTGTWQKFREAVKSTAGLKDASGNVIEDPIILGEEWNVATHYLLGDQFDSVMNYRFRNAIQTFIIGGDAKAFNDTLESIREDYPKEAWQVMLNLVDSHDTTRSITKLDFPNYEEEHLVIAPDATDKALKQQALIALFQMGYPGAPTVYYGDEVGLTGTKDPDSRRTFPWERVSENGSDYSGVGRYADLFATYKNAAAIRNTNEVFRTGDIKTAYSSGDVIAYARKTATQGGFVAINRKNEEQKIQADVTGFLPDGLILKDRLGGTIEAAVKDGKLELTLPAMSGVMMTSEGTLGTVADVQNLTAAAQNGKVVLNWEAPASGSVDGYRVYRSLIEGGELKLLGSVTSTSFEDTTVDNATKYYYAVTGYKGNSEGLIGGMVSATPSFKIDNVAAPSSVLEAVYLKVGHKVDNITVEVTAAGLTDKNAGKAAPNLLGKLYYYTEGQSPADATSTVLRYQSDNGAAKVYRAAFEPTVAGDYHYYGAFSTDNGETWTLSPETVLTVFADDKDTTPPAAPVLSGILQESSRANLSWTVAEDAADDIAGFEIYRSTSVSDTVYSKIAVLSKDKRSYIDFTVNNDTTYKYWVAAFDQSYNRSYSDKQAVTPKLVMVDVTMRLHLPDYTPTTDDITIAGDFQGWNVTSTKLTVPSGATNRDVVEYSFKMMAGKTIQYKYARGDWDKEAFTSHTRLVNDTTDPGNWAYSSTDTNMQLKITNQGNNKMVVEDYVLRWSDMPMAISQPRKSYGADIAYETTEDRFNLKAVVPYGVAFTINGQPIQASEMDSQGNVSVANIPLAVGLNTFELHIEPTQETLNLPFYTDKGRASKATKTITMKITRTDDGGVTPTNPSTIPTPLPTKAPEAVTLTADKIVPDSSGNVAVTLPAAATRLVIPANAGALLNGGSLVVTQGDLVVSLPAAVLQEAGKGLADAGTIALDILPASAAKPSLPGAAIQVASGPYAFTLSAITDKGTATVIHDFAVPITLQFHVNGSVNHDLTNVYFISDQGNLEYAGGTWSGNTLSASVKHFSIYAALEVDRSFADVPAAHWASAAIKSLAAKQIVTGTSVKDFAPSKQVTRAEFAAMLVRALGLTTTKGTAFKDVPATAWYAPAVAAAYDAGILSGRSADSFAPNAAITREEMAVMLMKAYAYGKTKQDAASAAGTTEFRDAAQFSSWSAASIRQAADLGVLNGRDNGNFAPKANLTRAESAKALYLLLTK